MRGPVIILPPSPGSKKARQCALPRGKRRTSGYDEGKVAFIEKETGVSRELSAGSSLTYYIAEHRFASPSLRFENAPLSEVIAALQKTSGRQISLDNAALGQKRLTIDLEGETFDNAIKTICASLNLEYAEKNGVYILKSRNSVTSPM